MSEQLTERYPIDYETLERGMAWTEAELERIFSIFPRDCATVDEALDAQKKLRFKAMDLGEEIKQRIANQTGEVVSITYRDGGLTIRTAEEQDEHCKSEYRRVLRDLLRTLACDVGNDTSLLSDEAQRERIHRINVESWRALQLRKKPPPELTNKTEQLG